MRQADLRPQLKRDPLDGCYASRSIGTAHGAETQDARLTTIRSFGLAVVAAIVASPLLGQVPRDTIRGASLDVRSVIATLVPGGQVRVATRLGTITGRVVDRAGDSLTVSERTSGTVRTIAVSHIDTLWIPTVNPSHGVLVGAGLGGLFGGLLASQPDGDDPGLNRMLGVAVFVVGTVAGLIVDSRPEHWVRTYP